MNKRDHTSWLLLVCILTMVVTACNPILPVETSTLPALTQTPTTTMTTLPFYSQTPSPENAIHILQNQPGWFVARILTKDAENESPEEILRILVIQWLEHYKTQNESPTAAIKDYTFDGIYKVYDVTHDPFNGIVASVNFSIIPAQTPTDWASFPSMMSITDNWWHFGGLFHAFRAGEYFKLILINASLYFGT